MTHLEELANKKTLEIQNKELYFVEKDWNSINFIMEASYWYYYNFLKTLNG